MAYVTHPIEGMGGAPIGREAACVVVGVLMKMVVVVPIGLMSQWGLGHGSRLAVWLCFGQPQPQLAAICWAPIGVGIHYSSHLHMCALQCQNSILRLGAITTDYGVPSFGKTVRVGVRMHAHAHVRVARGRCQ